jgi:hypothetical protein
MFVIKGCIYKNKHMCLPVADLVARFNVSLFSRQVRIRVLNGITYIKIPMFHHKG